ncbi:MAG: Gfo/Idh/MocA family oxidoreductase [Lachnospiraceae bacterium]|nr:Gfo/Idh/MocA family oxidoreductase [Lachnospiraceae bacterium]
MNFLENGRKVKVAVIGLGIRGRVLMKSLVEMADVQVVAVCDMLEERLELALEIVRENSGACGYTPEDVLVTTDYKEVLGREDVEAIINASSWQVHHRITIAALEAGKHVGMEVGGANSVQECWDMVRAAERSGKFCMPIANACYCREEMTLINMVRQGLFGEVVHCQGGYGHDRRTQIGKGDIEKQYRQLNFTKRNGELYPMHAIGYISKILGINRGNRMLSLISVSSKAAGLHQWYADNRPDTPFAKQQINQGDIVNTLIKCANGETISLTHDCSLPRPYSRLGGVHGTRGLWVEDKGAYHLEKTAPWDDTIEAEWHPFEEAMEQYEPKLWKDFRASGKTGTHGGSDYLVLRAFVETVQNQDIPPVDVYDAALWTAITCLSEESIATGGFVGVPDFTNGRWMNRGDDVCTADYSFDSL